MNKNFTSFVVWLWLSVFIAWAACEKNENGNKELNKNDDYVIYPDDILQIQEKMPEYSLILEQSDSANGLSFHRIMDMQYDHQGNIYILDSGNYRIVKISTNGELITSFGQKGLGPGEFKNPSLMALDSLQNIYIYDDGKKKVEKYNKNGKLLISVEVKYPVSDMVVDGKGNLYLALRELFKRKGTQLYLYKYISSDSYSSRVLMLQKNVEYKIGGYPGDLVVSTMQVDNFGRLFFSLFEEYAVHIFTEKGKILKTFGREMKKIRLPNFYKNMLVSKKQRLPESEKLMFKIPDFYPNKIRKILIDHARNKIYVITTEDINEIMLMNKYPVFRFLFIDKYDFEGKMENRIKIRLLKSNIQIFDVHNEEFVALEINPKVLPKVVRFSLKP